MNIRKRSGARILLACVAVLLCSLFLSKTAFAAACTAAASTAWNVQTTWGAAGVGCVGATGGIPGASDTVSIGASGTPRAVTVPSGYSAQALGMSIGGTGTNGASRLTLSASDASVTIGASGLTISGPANNNTNGLFVNAGSATVNGDVVFNDTSGNGRIANVTITTGSLDVNGSITMNATSSSARNSIVMSGGAGNLFVSGSFTLASSLGTLTPGTTSTVTFDTGSTATVATGGAVSYRNLKINKSGGTASTAAAGNLTVGGDLTVQAGTFSIVTSGTTAVTGNLDVQAGLFDIATTANATVTGSTTATGEVRISAGTGTRTFTGNVTVSASTGKWNNTANAAVTMSGDLTNDNTNAGSFVSGTGAYTHTAAGKVFAGAGGLVFNGNLVISGTRTNNTTLEVKGDLSGGSTLTNAAGQTLKLGGNANAITTLTATAAGNIVNYNGSASQIVENTTYYHLIISNTAGAVTTAGNFSITGDFTNNNAGFDPVTGTDIITFSGSAAQSISGSALTTFYSLTLNNSSGLSLSGPQGIKVTDTLTLTNGTLATGTNSVFVSRNAAAAVARTNGFVEGNLKWTVPIGTNVARTFPVGTGTTYAPVAITFASITTTGDITISSTAGSHPELANSGLDTTTPYKLNRYWTISNSGVAFTNYGVTFNFAAGDLDSGVTTSALRVVKYVSGSWDSTTLGTAGATSISITGETEFGDFAVGEVLGLSSSTGWFNAYDAPPITSSGSVSGRLRTKLTSTSFDLTVVHLNASGTSLVRFGGGGTTTVIVDLIDGAVETGAFTSGCWDSWISATAIASNSAVFNNNSTTNATMSFSVSNAYKDVRVRISGGGQTGCSGDRFSIRPALFAITSTNAANTGTSGSPAIKAGASFNLTATAVAGYDGTPLLDAAQVVGTPTAGTLGGTFGVASSSTGISTGNSFTYSEVGNFGLNANAVYDASFTSVDQPLDCTDDFSNTLVNGEYGCKFGSTAVAQSTGSSGFGRFIPDHFALSAASLTNRSSSGCSPASAFSYMGEPIKLQFTLTAQNSANATTQNYAGSYAKLDAGAVSSYSLGARDSGGAGTNLSSRLDTGGSIIGSWAAGVASAVELTTAITRNASADGAYDQTRIGIAPVDSDGVSLLTSAYNIDVDNAGGADHQQVGSDTRFRFGQLQLLNAHGSQALALAIPVEIQYWTGAIFQRNVLDNCTTLVTNNFTLGNRTGGLTGGGSGNMENSKLTGISAVSNGLASLTLAKPDGGAQGSVEIALNLGSGASADACPSWAPAATAANRAYLRGNWCGTGYAKDPVSKATFGIYRSRFISRRENF